MRFHMAACLMAVSFASVAQGVNVDDAGTQVLGAAGGRYFFGQISDARRDQYMLDSQTGRLWQMTCMEDKPAPGTPCGFAALSPIGYSNGSGTYNVLPQPVAGQK